MGIGNAWSVGGHSELTNISSSISQLVFYISVFVIAIYFLKVYSIDKNLAVRVIANRKRLPRWLQNLFWPEVQNIGEIGKINPLDVLRARHPVAMMIVLYERPHILSVGDLLLIGCSMRQLKQWGYSKTELLSLHRKNYRISQTMQREAMLSFKQFASSSVYPDRIFAPISRQAIGAFDRIGSNWSRNETILINRPRNDSTCVALRDGTLVIGDVDGIILVDWQTGKCLKTIQSGRSSWVESIVELVLEDNIVGSHGHGSMSQFSSVTGGLNKRCLPSTRIIVGASSSDYSAVEIWNLSTCVCEATLVGHSRELDIVLMLTCGAIATTCRYNGVISVWHWQRDRPYAANAKTKTKTKNWPYTRAHTINTKSQGSYTCTALKYKRIAALNRDYIISVYDYSIPRKEEDYCIKVLDAPNFHPICICALGDGVTLAAIGLRHFVLWDTLTWSPVKIMPSGKCFATICSLTTLSDGITMLSADSHGIVNLWECYHSENTSNSDVVSST